MVDRRKFLKNAAIAAGAASTGYLGGFVGGVVVDQHELGRNFLHSTGNALAQAYATGLQSHEPFYALVSEHVIKPAIGPDSGVTAEALKLGIDPLAEKLDVHPYRVLKALITPEKKLTKQEAVTLDRVEKAASEWSEKEFRKVGTKGWTRPEVFSRLNVHFNQLQSTDAHENLAVLGGEHFSEKVLPHHAKNILERPGYRFSAGREPSAILER